MLSADSDRGRAHWCDVAQWEEGCPTVGTEAARTGVNVAQWEEGVGQWGEGWWGSFLLYKGGIV